MYGTCWWLTDAIRAGPRVSLMCPTAVKTPGREDNLPVWRIDTSSAAQSRKTFLSLLFLCCVLLFCVFLFFFTILGWFSRRHHPKVFANMLSKNNLTGQSDNVNNVSDITLASDNELRFWRFYENFNSGHNRDSNGIMMFISMSKSVC